MQFAAVHESAFGTSRHFAAPQNLMERPCADSEEKREPVSDIDTVLVDSLKALDPERPIREADKRGCG
jgi:hypothetical protein